MHVSICINMTECIRKTGVVLDFLHEEKVSIFTHGMFP